jgi:CubicO group peptidase (beta-lactamase class C family)
MHVFFRGLGVSLCWLLASSGVAQAASVDHSETVEAPIQASIDNLFARWNKPNAPGCAFGVLKDGAWLHRGGYGLANIEHDARNSPTTVFHIASVSKQFTAFAIHLLAQEGKLSLDDDIRKYLPEMHDFGKTITIRHLIHHTSGLRDQWNLLTLAGWRMDDVITEEDILRLLQRQRALNFSPGDEELYSNTGYTLLAVIVKRVSGESFRQFTTRRIFEPLGMANTRFQDEYGFVIKHRASSYAPQPDGTYKYHALSYSNVGATSLHTTVEDLARWDANFYDMRVGDAALFANLHIKGKLNSGAEISYASALVHGEYRGLRTVEHGGGDAGFRTDLLRFPEQHWSAIVLCNAADANPGQLARSLADLYLAERMKPLPTAAKKSESKSKREIKVSADTLAMYTGIYELMPGFTLTIAVDGGKPYVRGTGQPTLPLLATAEREFLVSAVDARLTFDKPVKGSSPGVTLHQGGFDRRAPRIEIVELQPPAMQRYTGQFYSEELNVIYQVEVRDGQLKLQYPRGELPMTALSATRFSASWPVFNIDYDCMADSCSGFKVSNGRVRNVQFKRIEL